MKLLKQLFPVFIVLALWSSCTTDDSPIPGVIAPTSSISSTSETIMANGSFSVVLTALSGDSPLNTLTIQKDGATVAAANITINAAAAAANPILLFGADKTSLSYNITIQTNLMSGETANYSFVIDAENNDNTTETTVVDVAVPTIPPTLVYDNGGGNWPPQAPGVFLPNDPITATQTDALLSTFAAYENGVLMTASRVYFGATQFTENPRILTANEQDGFSADLSVLTHSAEDTRTYMFILTDVNGLSDTIMTDVTVVASTALSLDTAGIVFFNRAGQGQGGLDLDLPGAVSSTSVNAHIRDLGIDQNMPNATNWIRQVEAVNGSTIILLASADFDAIGSKEDVTAAYDAGSGAPTTLSDGIVIGVTDANGVKYIVRFDTVTMTAADNADNYSVSIKY